MTEEKNTPTGADIEKDALGLEKDWDGQLNANNTQKTASDSQIEPKLKCLNEFQIAKLKKVRTRPNNYCLIVPILPNSPPFHIAELKMTGRGTPTETVRQGDVTVIKYSNKKIVIYLKKKFAKSVLYSEEFRNFHNNIKSFLAKKLYDFMQKYPNAYLDWTNSVLYPRDIGIRDPNIDINEKLTWNKPIHKKVYMNKEFEIKNAPERHFDSVEGASAYIDNRVLENRLPKVEFVINRFTDQVQLHLDVETRQSNLTEKQNQLLAKQNEVLDAIKNNLKRETFMGKVNKFFWKLCKKSRSP